MNLFLISLLDTMVERNIELFCRMDFVKSAIYLSNLNELSMRLQAVADFYYKFLHQIGFLPIGVFKVDYIPNLETDIADHRLQKILAEIDKDHQKNYDILPVHRHYSDQDTVHLVAGIMKMEDSSITFLHLVDLHIPKNLIKMTPSTISYLREILESYGTNSRQSLRDLVRVSGHNYNQFQKDCRTFFGDTFYSFIQKKKIMDAVDDIIFTSLSFKEIAFKNRFVDYPNMYKTFSKYGIALPSIPRLANL